MQTIFKQDEEKKFELHALETIETFNRLVEILRYSTVEELEIMEKSLQTETKIWLFLDALSVAASRNSIKLLVEIIKKEESIDQFKAAQVLKNLGTGSGLPAPSEKQINLILELCKHDQLLKKDLVRQSCWLTFGSMVHEFVQQIRKNQETSKITKAMPEQRYEILEQYSEVNIIKKLIK